MHIDNLDKDAPTDEQARILRGDLQGGDECGMDVTDADITATMMNTIMASVIDCTEPAATLACVAGERDDKQATIAAALSKFRADIPFATNTDVTFVELQPALISPIDGDEILDQGEMPEHDALQPAPPQPLNVPFGPEPPPFRVAEQIKLVHNSRVGHFGVLTTYRRLLCLQDCCWGLSPRELREEVTRFVKACPECQKAEGLPSPWQATRFIRQRPFREISIDVLQMPNADCSGARKVFTCLCSFSRAVEFFPLEFADAPRCAECLHWIRCRYGPFGVVRCDGAKAFVQSIVPLYLRLCGTQLHSVTAFVHWENGQVERAHRSVLRHLRHLISSDAAGPNSQRSWVTLLSAARRIMMNTVNASTGETPNAFVYGGFADTETDMFLAETIPKSSGSREAHQFVTELQNEQLAIVARGEDYQQALLEKVAAKAIACDVALPEGSYVLAYRAGMPHGRPVDKTQYRWSGPWRVLGRGQDDAHPRVSCMHLASKIVSDVSIHELKMFNIDLLDSEDDLASVAERDDWDYTVSYITQHRPVGIRRRRPKSSYEFLVHYKYLEPSTEPGQENPSWQPYDAVRHCTALQLYCARADVLAQLGANFFVSEDA